MTPETDYIHSLFASVGISANVSLDETNSNLIIIDNSHFTRLQEWIELWLRPVAQDRHNTYLRERLPKWNCFDVPTPRTSGGNRPTLKRSTIEIVRG
jgi:hypothetical protein